LALCLAILLLLPGWLRPSIARDEGEELSPQQDLHRDLQI